MPQRLGFRVFRSSCLISDRLIANWTPALSYRSNWHSNFNGVFLYWIYNVYNALKISRWIRLPHPKNITQQASNKNESHSEKLFLAVLATLMPLSWTMKWYHSLWESIPEASEVRSSNWNLWISRLDLNRQWFQLLKKTSHPCNI